MKNAKSMLDGLMNTFKDLTGGQSPADLATKAKGAWDGQSTLAKGAIAGGLLGVLLSGNARRLVGSAASVGGAALIGGLAYKAYEDWKAGKSADDTGDVVTLPAPAGTAFAPIDTDEADDLAARLLRAMVSAAKADGHVTEAERARIDGHLATLGLQDEAVALITDELDAPLDVSRVAALAASPEEATQVYVASLLVVDPDGVAEQDYLAKLATSLKLDAGLVAQLHAKAASLA